MDSLDILMNIRKIVRSLNLESKSLQKDFGLSITQLLCLGHLEKSNQYRSTHKELMELLSLNSSTITGIVNRLEKRGYVARVHTSNDKRVTFITLTAAGIKLLEDTPNILHDRLEKKLNKLSSEERDMIKKAMEIIISAMHINKVDASPLLTSEDPIN